jgi:HPt (histidine-containing phosphotransfer) domain-containing protein
MAYDPGAIDAALSAAVGDEPALIAELRRAFLDGATRAVQAMRAAPSDDEWRSAATRLRGLAASFGAVRLMALAASAAEGSRDGAMAAKLERAVARL